MVRMKWCMVELSVRCPRCDAPVHLDGPRRRATCGACMGEFDFPVEVWRDTLSEAVAASRSMQAGKGCQSTIFGHFNMTLLYGNQVPYCPECKEDFDTEVDRAGERLVCRACGGAMGITGAPEWFRSAVKKAKLIAGGRTDGSMPGSQAIDTPPGSGPVALGCPKCSASLMIDGKERLVPCGYCGTRVYLPDDLWLRLHPAGTKRRWFIGF